jgi:prevent-host-death family protein
MSAFSVADAKNSLPKLIDLALKGEEVTITRHGKTVAEIRAASARVTPATATYSWLKARRRSRASIGLTSVQILDRIYEPEKR